MIYFISRHIGAQQWAQENGFEDATVVAHFDPEVVREGDVVVGVLPVHLAARVCSRGVRYYHLVMNVPAELRGTELTCEIMNELGATVSEFIVHEVVGVE